MGFEVIAKTTPMHHSSLQIEVVVLDSAATYQSGTAQSGASEQGDDLEHTGHTSFSHSQRQPAHLTNASAQARGTSSASS